MKKALIICAALMFSAVLAGCTDAVNLTDMQENTQQSTTEVVTEAEKINYAQKLELTRQEEFYLNAFSTSITEKPVFEIVTEDYSKFTLKSYKFADGSWQYTNRFWNGDIKSETTYLTIEYFYLPYMNIAWRSGSSGADYHDDADIYDGYNSFTWDDSIRGYFDVTEEETAIIAFRRTKSDNGQKLANTSDFANPAAIRNADENDEYYVITISFSK